MEIRTLKYFLEVAREENMTRAAERLHVTQPTLSKQLKALEEELGRKLFTRRSFSIRLTDEGRLLRDRASDLVEMSRKIEGEFRALNDITGGELSFGLAESHHIRYLARVIRTLKEKYRGLRYRVISGDTGQVDEKLDKGLLDFAVLAETPDYRKYDVLPFPEADRWGLVMPENSPLAARESVTVRDLIGIPLFASEQSQRHEIAAWCGDMLGELDFEGSFSLAYNGAVFVREGLGCMLTFEHLVDTSEGSGLAFRPLEPTLETRLYLIRSRSRPMTPIAERFLSAMRGSFADVARTAGAGI